MSTAALAVASVVALLAAEGGARSRPASSTWWGPPAPDALPPLGAAATVHHGAARGLRAAAAVAFLGAVATELAADGHEPLVGLAAWTAIAVLLGIAVRNGVRDLRAGSERPPTHLSLRPPPPQKEPR